MYRLIILYEFVSFFASLVFSNAPAKWGASRAGAWAKAYSSLLVRYDTIGKGGVRRARPAAFYKAFVVLVFFA